MLEHALLYFIPSRGEFLKTQPGTGDNLLREDIAEGYTDYILWSTFKPAELGIDGELEMECLDSGMLLLKGDPGPEPGMTATRIQDDNRKAGMTLKDILEQAYGDSTIKASLLLG